MQRRERWTAVAVLAALTTSAALADTPKKPAAPKAAATKAKPRPAATVNPEEAAQAAAESWLLLIDQAKYAEAWDVSAKPFRDSVPRDQFTQGVAAQRAKLGALVSRKLKLREKRPAAADGSSGDYVAIEHTAEFAKVKNAIESVAVVAEGKGWRIAGYQVAPPR
jgi:hypothetical protein